MKEENKFNLQEALDGYPVLTSEGHKGWLSRSSRNRNIYILELEHSSIFVPVPASELDHVVRGMWSFFTFDHWDVLPEETVYISLEDKDNGIWLLLDEWHHVISETSAHAYCYNFFPPCPEGTLIKRPETTTQPFAHLPDDDIPF